MKKSLILVFSMLVFAASVFCADVNTNSEGDFYAEQVSFIPDEPFVTEINSSGYPEDSKRFDFLFNKKIIPVGAKAVIRENFRTFSRPSYDSEELDSFNAKDIVTVAQITSWDNLDKKDMEESDFITKRHWVKVISSDLTTGWIQDFYLIMLSDNPNHLCVKPEWKYTGSLGAAFSPDGKYVCFKDWGRNNSSRVLGDIHVFEAATRRLVLNVSVAKSSPSASSRHVVFSKDSQNIFYQENLQLCSVNIKTKEIKKYERPFKESAVVENLLINEKGDKILFLYGEAKNKATATLWNLKDGTNQTVYTKEEAEKIRKDVSGSVGEAFTPRMADFADKSHWRFIPKKNIAICCPSNRWNFLTGLYFFELDTGRFLKAEDPLARNSSSRRQYITEFEVNADGTKIAFLAAEPRAYADDKTYYVCDLDVTKLTPVIPEEPLNKTLKADNDYLCSQRFSLAESQSNPASREYEIWFDYDNTYYCSKGNDTKACYGTYSLKEQDGKSVIHFEPVYGCCDGWMEDSEKERLNNVLTDGYIDKTDGDIFDVGGIVREDWNSRFVRTKQRAIPGEIYKFNGVSVIKYPDLDSGEAVFICPRENLKMRQTPSITGKTVYMNFRSYYEDEYVDENRCVVYAGEEFHVLGSSTLKQTIDGISDYWYLIFVRDGKLDENYELAWSGKYVWIFGGYADIEKNN